MKTHSFRDRSYTDIFFDLDRTLWDFERNARETFMDLYHKYQLSHHYDSFDMFYETYREYNDELWLLYRSGQIDKETLSWKRFDLTLKDVEYENEVLAKDLAKDYLLISPTKKKLFPHTLLSLTFLKKQYKLHLITNGFKEVQYTKVKNSGLDKYFNNIFVSEEVGINKPHADFFKYAMKKAKAKRKNSLVIGDDITVDIQGAVNVGVDSIWINHNEINLGETDIEIRPTYEISSLRELIHIL